MLKIFPNPKTIIYEEGMLIFKPNFFVEFSHEPDEEYNFGVKKLVDCIKEYTGSQLSSKKGEDTTVISFMLDEDLQKEEYRIDVFDEEIIIRNSGWVSAFRAITTFNQVLKQCTMQIPQFTLVDKPDIENRGIMIDVSNGKLPEKEELQKLIDFISEIKYNQLHLYIDDVVFAYPDFLESVKELSVYCKERCIELVPNHNYFEQDKKNFSNTISYCESNYIGIGYTEINEETYAKFLLEIDELSKKYGKQTLFRDDKFILNPETMKKLPRDIIPLERGDEPDSTTLESRVKFLAEEGFDFYVCPEINGGQIENAFANQREYAVCGKKYKALGYMFTDLGNGWYTQSPETSLVPYIYGGGVSWGVDENSDVNDAIALINDLEQL